MFEKEIFNIERLIERKEIRGEIEAQSKETKAEIVKALILIQESLDVQGTLISNVKKNASTGQLEARTSVLNAKKELTETIDKEIAKLRKEIKEIELLKPKDGKDGKDGDGGKNGKDGKDGKNGENGKDGKNGKDGLTIKGQDGQGITDAKLDGDDLVLVFDNGTKKNVGRVKGLSGNGQIGASAYRQALNGGYTGTEQEFETLLANVGQGGASGTKQVYVQPTNPNLTTGGIWIQTIGEDMTFWIEDGV